MMKGRLKLFVFDHARITHERTAMVIPFAQRETIDMIIRGIPRDLAERLAAPISDGLKLRRRRTEARDDSVPAVVERFRESMQKEISEKYSDPFMTAVTALPRHDLAAMAEALVSPTAFRAHASAGEREIVAGSIDVAVLSNGDGFVWVRRTRFGAT